MYKRQVFDSYIGDASIKAVTLSKRMGKKMPICKVIDGPHVPLPQVWSQFIELDDNKASLAQFISEIIMEKGKELPERFELVTAGGGFSDATDSRSTRRDDVSLRANHEEADTRLILHSCEAVNEGHEKCWSSAETHMLCFFWFISCQRTQLKCG